jgi:cell division GTPase FtsZ
MRDVDLLQRAKAILEAIMENKEAMGPYGVSDELISDLSKKIEIYDAKSNDKEGNFAESKNARQALTEAFEHANEILIEEVDSIMEYIKDIHADFYGKYQ